MTGNLNPEMRQHRVPWVEDAPSNPSVRDCASFSPVSLKCAHRLVEQVGKLRLG
jgi:hypothetical protein